MTLDGDVYEPSGTLTGGAQKSSSSVLTQLTQLHEAEMALAEAKETMARLTVCNRASLDLLLQLGCLQMWRGR